MAESVLLLVGIDDLQWLDEPTRRVVSYAVRRCHGPVAILTAERREREETPGDGLAVRDATRVHHLRIPPLTLGALHHVVREGMGRSFARPVMVRIADLSGGNPFYALELARSIDHRDPRSVPTSTSLSKLVRDHVRTLSPAVRDALLVASTLADPRLEVVAHACGGGDVAELMAPAEDAGIVQLSGGRVRFTHPLLATGVYAEASPAARRALHRRLSGLVDDPEEQARHLALASTGLEPEAVSALDAAAERARRRGAVSAAAELLELAIGLGAVDSSRLVHAARDHFDADNPVRARELLERAVDALPLGAQRAEALGLLGAVTYESEDFGRAAEILERAFREAEDAPTVRSSIAAELGIAAINQGRVADALSYAEIAAEEAERARDDGLLAEALGGVAIFGFLNGRGVDWEILSRALALEDPNRRSHAIRWPLATAALLYLWTDQLERARDGFTALERRCLERGAETDLWYVLGHASRAALAAGDVETAERYAEEMAERAGMAGSDPTAAVALAVQALVGAWIGRVDQARAAAQQAVAGLAETRFAAAIPYAMGAVGMGELSIGAHNAAAQWLAPAAAQMLAMGYAEPAAVPFFPDAAEALIAGGHLDEARPIVDHLEAAGRRPDRKGTMAAGARCRGLLLAAEGRLDDALAAFERAVAAHVRLPLRYEEGRTLLAMGRLQRRRNERRAARASLERAAQLFGEVGTAQWAAKAREELDRLGVRAGPPEELTATEERVATLAAAGKTNREVAAELAVSPKTVEANLARVYRKLGIRSRAELGQRMAERRPRNEPATT